MYRFGQACLGTEDLECYLDRINQAAALDEGEYGPKLGDAYRIVAGRYASAGDVANCARFLELAVREKPLSAEWRYTLGNVLYEAGRLREATLQWRLTLELQPHHPDRARMLELIRDGSAGAGGRSQQRIADYE